MPAIYLIGLLGVTSSLLLASSLLLISPLPHIAWILGLLPVGLAWLGYRSTSLLLRPGMLSIILPYVTLPIFIPFSLGLPTNGFFTLYGLIALTVQALFLLHARQHFYKEFLAPRALPVFIAGAGLGLIATVLFVWLHINVTWLILLTFVAIFSVRIFFTPQEAASLQHASWAQKLSLLLSPPLQHFLQLQTVRTLATLAGTFWLMCAVIRWFISHSSSNFGESIYLALYSAFTVTVCILSKNNPLRFFCFMAVMALNGYLFYLASPLHSISFFGISSSSDFLFIISILSLLANTPSPILYYVNTPYGSVEVAYNRQGNQMLLLIKGIIQGAQYCAPEKRNKPDYYFSKETPAGQFLSTLPENALYKHMAVVGLGTGTIAAYGKASQDITFYEINPEIIQIANNPAYFSYLKDSKATVNVELGDARKTLSNAPDHHYGMIVIDAHTGTHAPKHLFTVEAIQLYQQKLHPEGCLLFDVTGPKEADVTPFLARTLHAAGFTAYAQYFFSGKREEHNTTSVLQPKGLLRQYSQVRTPLSSLKQWKNTVSSLLQRLLSDRYAYYHSDWVVAAKSKEFLLTVPNDSRWKPLSINTATPLWTDASLEEE